ncbi:hypothetical protein T11_13087 [Trichinella zimbabwensis]|uniref:Uncharacterized protein n=1 Tax=Trichinella zimbabwensis TaxID=268475 RepID=A0A0V1HCL0_9BILA|nr:hypothetical protein T11_13087 [Trichinella zimbabwensis]
MDSDSLPKSAKLHEFFMNIFFDRCVMGRKRKKPEDWVIEHPDFKIIKKVFKDHFEKVKESIRSKKIGLLINEISDYLLFLDQRKRPFSHVAWISFSALLNVFWDVVEPNLNELMHETLRIDIEKDRIKIYNSWCATMRRVLGKIRLNGKKYTKKERKKLTVNSGYTEITVQHRVATQNTLNQAVTIITTAVGNESSTDPQI